jgi:pantoate--beta-alanine ligase
MQVIERKNDMYQWSLAKRADGRSIGLVPTMGALHEGHLSLIREARSQCDAVVVSVFVNPTQFGPQEDLGTYPRTPEADCSACADLGVDAVFIPSAEEMYAASMETFVGQETLPSGLCGRSRPGHFRGVLTVVLKLLHITAPHQAYFGQKDYQQSVVIRRMVADLDVPVEVVVLPTVREADGLALSSRNRRLTADERRQAVCLFDALTLARKRFESGESSAAALQQVMRERIQREPSARIDYLEIVKPESLQPCETVQFGDVAALAVFIGNVRLIDNMIIA